MNNYRINDNTLYSDYNYLNGVINRTLAYEKVENAVFSIVFVDSNEIKKINNKYRHINEVTDVISFAFEDEKDLLYNDIRVLGDIFICIPRMKEQAKNYGHSEKRELSFLTVHGLLHLLGYDHIKKCDEVKMFAVQELILNDENITR